MFVSSWQTKQNKNKQDSYIRDLIKKCLVICVLEKNLPACIGGGGATGRKAGWEVFNISQRHWMERRTQKLRGMFRRRGWHSLRAWVRICKEKVLGYVQPFLILPLISHMSLTSPISGSNLTDIFKGLPPRWIQILSSWQLRLTVVGAHRQLDMHENFTSPRSNPPVIFCKYPLHLTSWFNGYPAGAEADVPFWGLFFLSSTGASSPYLCGSSVMPYFPRVLFLCETIAYLTKTMTFLMKQTTPPLISPCVSHHAHNR